MMLVIGGNSQGKLDYVKNILNMTDDQINDGEFCVLEEAFQKPVLNKLHLLVKRLMEADLDMMDVVVKGLEKNPAITVICDEIGCGIVPMKKVDREWREQVGRIQCIVAKKADIVCRVYCSLPVMIKGE